MCIRWLAIAAVWVACGLPSLDVSLWAQATGGDSEDETEMPQVVEDEESADTVDSDLDSPTGPDEELPPANELPGGEASDSDATEEGAADEGTLGADADEAGAGDASGTTQTPDLPAAVDPPSRFQRRSSRPQILIEPTPEEAPDSDTGVSPEEASGETEEEVEPEPGEVIAHEMIQERYEDGKVKVERGVAQDESENYVNHGPWKMYDPAGKVIAEGSYDLGERHGAWTRVYQTEDAELFTVAPFNLFTGPFVSQATFRRGKLHGHWIIRDANDQKVCDWNFVDGRREGESTWYYHTGRPMRVIHYRQGQLHGELLEWDVNNEPVTRVEYQDGRRLDKTTETYPDGQKKVEGQVLHARLVIKDPDDWWAAKLATYTRQGKDQKHGEWTAWYPSKQMKFTGTYQYDKPNGKFSWWHDNGQKSLEANYLNGEKSGSWVWWHANGQKAIQGQYLHNAPTERWVWWHESGKVAQRIDFSSPGNVVAGPASDGTNSILLRQPQN